MMVPCPSLPQDMSLQFFYGQDLHNQCFAADAIAPATYPPTLTTEPSFGSDSSSPSDIVYDIPSSVDMAYTTSNQTGFSDPTAWSSPSSASLEPSLPSSSSRRSLFPGQENSQSSYAMEDSSSNVSIHDEGFLPPSLVEIPAQAPYNGSDLQFDVSRFVDKDPILMTLLTAPLTAPWEHPMALLELQ